MTISQTTLDKLDPFERAGLIWPPSEELLMESAMVIWEHLIDAFQVWPHTQDPAGTYRYNSGAVETRHQAGQLARPLHVAWHLHEKLAGDNPLVPFDWEFTPWFMDHCVDWDADWGATLKENWLDIIRDMSRERAGNDF